MTWITTWPLAGIPQYAAHDTEKQAEAHATELVNSRRAAIATVFWTESDNDHRETRP